MSANRDIRLTNGLFSRKNKRTETLSTPNDRIVRVTRSTPPPVRQIREASTRGQPMVYDRFGMESFFVEEHAACNGYFVSEIAMNRNRFL